MAVVDIITSKTFDNGTICASEQTVVIDDEIYDRVLKKFAELGAHVCNEKETALLARTVIDPATGFMQPMAVGQKATDIARMIGLKVAPKTKLLLAPIQGVGREHPLSVEKLFPVLAVYRAKSVDEALRVCVDVNRAGGLGHTAVDFLAQRRHHLQVLRGDQRGTHHCEFAGLHRRAGRRLQRHGAHLLLRMRHRWRQQHHRQREHIQLPQHQTRGAEDTSPYVVPHSRSDLLQSERGGEPEAFPVALDHHHYQSGDGTDRPCRCCPALHPTANSGACFGHSRRGARRQDRDARSGGAQFLQSRSDHRAGRRFRDRRGEDHETQVRIAGGRPGRAGRAVPRSSQARGRVPDRRRPAVRG